MIPVQRSVNARRHLLIPCFVPGNILCVAVPNAYWAMRVVFMMCAVAFMFAVCIQMPLSLCLLARPRKHACVCGGGGLSIAV